MGERRSAKLLAFVLAMIMIASVLAYAFRNPSKTEQRFVKFEMGEDWRDWIKYLPNSSYIVYFNYTEKNETLIGYEYNKTLEFVNPVFGNFRPSLAYFKKMMIVDYFNYLIDVNRSRVYFSYNQKEDYKNFTMKIGASAGRLYAMVDEIHPVILAYPFYARYIIDSLNEPKIGYASRINGTFSYFIVLAGEKAMQALTDNGTPIADFYFEGYRMNGSVYEKVVGIHFIRYYFFAEMEENETAYYHYRNYNGFSIAKIGSYNFTYLINAMPEIRTVKVIK